jgi:hypothetical protein
MSPIKPLRRQGRTGTFFSQEDGVFLENAWKQRDFFQKEILGHSDAKAAR